MELPIYQLTINEDGEGVDYVALTDRPAIERNYQAFSSKRIRFAETEKRVLTGPLILADVPIYRNDAKMGECMVVLGRETIYKIVQKFFKQGAQGNVNIEHKTPIKGVFMFESFIIDRERGIMTPKGFEETNDGSWFGSYKVENDAIWADRANFRGFSVEGLFGMEKMESTIEVEMAKLEQAIKNFFATI